MSIHAVAVVRGRTRSLVERFERREKIQIDEDQTNVFLPTINETREKVHHEDQIKASPTVTIVCERREKTPLIEDQNNLPSVPKTTILETDKSPDTLVNFSPLYECYGTSIFFVASSLFYGENCVCI